MVTQESVPASTPMSLEEWKAKQKPHININQKHEESIKGLERVAVWVTDRVGTMGFFLVILTWTILWCGYNILASEVHSLHWKAFDPFPAFVAYLLMSNVIQLLLMPLIMVGQNLQGRHSELRAEHDLEVNVKAEKEIEVILMHLEHQQRILMQLVEAQGIKVDAIFQDTIADKSHAENAGVNAQPANPPESADV